MCCSHALFTFPDCLALFRKALKAHFLRQYLVGGLHYKDPVGNLFMFPDCLTLFWKAFKARFLRQYLVGGITS